MKARAKSGRNRKANQVIVIGRPWKIVAVIFDDGSTVRVTEAKLKRYLEAHDDKVILGPGWNRGSIQLRTSLRGLRRSIPKLQNLEKARLVHDADRTRTETLLKKAVRRLMAEHTPEHRVRALAAKEAGITRTRADQILGPVKKTKVRK